MAATSTQFGNLQKRHCVVEGSVARELLDEAGFLRLQATAWWSWSDSNQLGRAYLWNVGVLDQLTLSDTGHSISKRAANDGHFYKRGSQVAGHTVGIPPALTVSRE